MMTYLYIIYDIIDSPDWPIYLSNQSQYIIATRKIYLYL